MTKIFYTERDMVDLAQRGVAALEINDDVVLTDLAQEAALKHNIRLVRSEYQRLQQAVPDTARFNPEDEADLVRRVRSAVIARLGDRVDLNLLDAVVTRVIHGMK